MLSFEHEKEVALLNELHHHFMVKLEQNKPEMKHDDFEHHYRMGYAIAMAEAVHKVNRRLHAIFKLYTDSVEES